MVRINLDILGISELKWTGMDEFNSDDHGQESHGRNGIATKESEILCLGAASKMTECSQFISKASHSTSQ